MIVHVIIARGGDRFALCEISVMPTDASVYIHPAEARGGQYYWGHETFAPGERTKEIGFRANGSRDRPKVSIHQTGQVHLKDSTGTYLAGPVRIPPLIDLRGQHVATASADDFAALPPYDASTTTAGHEHVITAEPGVASGRVCIYVNSDAPAFPRKVVQDLAVITMQRPNLPGPMYVGLAPRPQHPLGPTVALPDRGATVVFGFDPNLGIEAEQNLLYVRAL